MYYELEVKDHIRVPPDIFDKDIESAIFEKINEKYEALILKDTGVVVGLKEIVNIGEGVIIPGDGAAYYDTNFKLIIFKPELQEVIRGKVSDITDFGAFIDLGPLDGMVHISQTMDDFVSFSKSNVLSGKESKRILKVNDQCKARIIAVSYKDITNPKIGLTMRQQMLGADRWFEEKKKKEVKKEGKKKGKKNEEKGV